MEVITRADGSVHVRLDTTPVKPRPGRPPSTATRCRRPRTRDGARPRRMEARRRARCSPKPPRTRAVDRLCAGGGRASEWPRTPPVARRALALAFRSGPTPRPAAALAARGTRTGASARPGWPPNNERPTGWWRRCRKLGLRGSDAPATAERSGPGVPPRVICDPVHGVLVPVMFDDDALLRPPCTPSPQSDQLQRGSWSTPARVDEVAPRVDPRPPGPPHAAVLSPTPERRAPPAAALAACSCSAPRLLCLREPAGGHK